MKKLRFLSALFAATLLTICSAGCAVSGVKRRTGPSTREVPEIVSDSSGEDPAPPRPLPPQPMPGIRPEPRKKLPAPFPGEENHKKRNERPSAPESGSSGEDPARPRPHPYHRHRGGPERCPGQQPSSPSQPDAGSEG